MKKNILDKKIVFLLVILFSSIAFAAPQLPPAFYGTATLNDNPVPVGSVITVQTGDSQVGKITVTEAGKVGGSTLEEGKLIAYEGESGDTLTFYIQTPEMTNKIQAQETAAWISGAVEEIALTFNGEIITTPPTDTSSTGSGSSGGGSGGGSSGEVPSSTSDNDDSIIKPDTIVDTKQGTQIEIYELDDDFKESESVLLSLSVGDEAKFTIGNKQHSLKVKAIGNGEVILTVSSEPFDITVKAGETKNVDVDADGTDDISVKINSVSNSKVKITLKRLAPSPILQTTTPTGLVTGIPVNSELALLVAGIVAVVGIGYWYRKK